MFQESVAKSSTQTSEHECLRTLLAVGLGILESLTESEE